METRWFPRRCYAVAAVAVAHRVKLGGSVVCGTSIGSNYANGRKKMNYSGCLRLLGVNCKLLKTLQVFERVLVLSKSTDLLISARDFYLQKLSRMI